MKLLNVKVYSGRNIYSHWPVIRADIDLGEYVNIPTCDIENFNDRLLSILPGLKSHKCSKGYINGFSQRLKEGTYLAHVMEHMALEIQNMLGYDVKFGKARYLKDDTVYFIVLSYINEVVGYESVKLAFNIINSLLSNKELDIDKELREIENKSYEDELGPSTAAIVKEAEKRKIPTMRIGENSIVQLGYGKYHKKIQATLTEHTSCMSVDIACDKELTNQILRTHGLPVPEGEVITTIHEAINASQELGFPVVIKPYNGNQGKGVSLNLSTKDEINKAFKIAKKYSDRILIEKFIEGKHYRIAVVGGKTIAASERIAAHIVGNGKNTIKELIHMENSNPLRGEGHQKPLTKIEIDDVTLMLLNRFNMDLNSVPKKGQVVYLRENDNLSTGGIAIDVTDNIHPDNVKLAERAAQIIGLDVAGVDITTKDISKSIIEEGGSIIEVNACPGIRMHHFPSKGKPRNVAKAIVELLFPEDTPHSVPVISITGTNGKTTITRMVNKILKANSMIVGMTSTGGIYIDTELVMKGDTTGPRSAELVLMDRNIDVALLETARGGIVNKGLAYDLADVGVITNIGDDHIGIDGINTLEDMAYVKSLIVEAVKPEGYSVINADDIYAEKISERARGNIIYFSRDFDNKLVNKNKQNGEKAIYLKGNTIYIFDGKQELPTINVENIPATFGGALEHNVENSLCAVATSYGIGVAPSIISKGLSEFNTDSETNPGRFNLFDVGDFKVVIDYGHNIDGYSRIIKGLQKMKKNRLIGVIGVPGDRTDISILKIGELCGKSFDHVYIKEDKDLRDRKPGEVAQLLKQGCTLGKLSEAQITIELNEKQALIKAMENAKPGDTIIVFYEEYEHLVDSVEGYKKKIKSSQISEMQAVAGKL